MRVKPAGNDIVQTDCTARLASLEYFSDIYVAAPRLYKDGEKQHTPKTITQMVDQALIGTVKTGGKIGATVRVFQPTFRMIKTNGRDGSLSIVCRCEVHPLYNFSDGGTNKNVSEIAWNVLRALQGFSIQGIAGSLFADGDCLVPYFSEDRKMMTADVILQCSRRVVPLDSVVMPVISLIGNQVTLTNATAGADIYFTRDISLYPSRLVPGAQLYNGPFNAASGTVVRWAAYMPGLAGSFAGYQLIP
jgi:hypothetical protein